MLNKHKFDLQHLEPDAVQSCIHTCFRGLVVCGWEEVAQKPHGPPWVARQAATALSVQRAANQQVCSPQHCRPGQSNAAVDALTASRRVPQKTYQPVAWPEYPGLASLACQPFPFVASLFFFLSAMVWGFGRV